MNRSRRPTSSIDTKTIVFLAAPSTQILDVTGPFQVFVRASEIFMREHSGKQPPYRVLLASTTRRKSITTNCGLVLTTTDTFRSLRNPIDTLLTAGGTGVEKASNNEELLRWLRRTAKHVRRIGSVCTGAFLLASAGLLEGKRVATHWKWAGELAQRFKNIAVDPDPIYIRDGNTFTTAGVTAGMDLALALVEDDLGSSVALQVARELVLYLHRNGGQSQFSTAPLRSKSDGGQMAYSRSLRYRQLTLWKITTLEIERHIHESDHNRDFNQGTDHCSECRSGIDAEYRNSHGDRQLEIVRSGRK
jgi:transcriptional regulator GlxA family with amidase domain